MSQHATRQADACPLHTAERRNLTFELRRYMTLVSCAIFFDMRCSSSSGLLAMAAGGLPEKNSRVSSLRALPTGRISLTVSLSPLPLTPCLQPLHLNPPHHYPPHPHHCASAWLRRPWVAVRACGARITCSELQLTTATRTHTHIHSLHSSAGLRSFTHPTHADTHTTTPRPGLQRWQPSLLQMHHP